jgi:hypothetical protein
MALFRTHREAAKASNRVTFGFVKIITLVTLAYIAVVAVHYLLGWW